MVTALRETWARRRCILNTRNYHKQASTTSKAHFTRRSSSSSGSHSACQLPWLHPCAASSASVASSSWGASASEWAVAARPAWPSASPGPSVGRPCQSTVACPGPPKGRGCLPPSLPPPLLRLLRSPPLGPRGQYLDAWRGAGRRRSSFPLRRWSVCRSSVREGLLQCWVACER